MAYILQILLIFCGAIPLAMSLFAVMLVSGGIHVPVVAGTLFLSGIAAGLWAANGKRLPDQWGRRYGPVAFPLGYTVLLWAICMAVSGGFYGHAVWLTNILLQFPFLPIHFAASLYGLGTLYLLSPLSYHSGFLLGFVVRERQLKPRIAIHRKQLAGAAAFILLAFGIGGTIEWQRSQTVLPSYGFQYGGGYSSTDLWPYEIDNPDNLLPRLSEPSTLVIEDPEEMLVLDGAEAAFPVYSAFAQAVYDHKNLGLGDRVGKFVTFTNTIYAYELLLDREIDIYFGAEPSADQWAMANERGIDLVLTPIGKEAFVFFVNPQNPVRTLQVSEIRDIYSGKVRNWKEIGGDNAKIVAFQRPKNSGSQTLLEKIMGDVPIMQPLKEEVPRGMGGILEQVADYRNYENSIGFSFRFFATGMKQQSDIRLLAINGIEPNADNIQTEVYPFTANLYAITRKDNSKPMTASFLDWMQGPQGQQLVEEVGYVPLRDLSGE